jgi:hypothetical protein
VATEPTSRRRSPFSLSPVGTFAAAFIFLLGATAAVAMGQLTASRVAPWLSIAYSAGAIVCTIVALVKRPRT